MINALTIKNSYCIFPPSLPDAFHQIIRDEGVLALWNGTFPSLLLVFNPAIQFMFYEGFKRKLLKKQQQVRLTGLEAIEKVMII